MVNTNSISLEAMPSQDNVAILASFVICAVWRDCKSGNSMCSGKIEIKDLSDPEQGLSMAIMRPKINIYC